MGSVEFMAVGIRGMLLSPILLLTKPVEPVAVVAISLSGLGGRIKISPNAGAQSGCASFGDVSK